MKGIAIYFFIFGVHWGKGVKGGPLGGTKKKRKTTKKNFGLKNFFGPKFFLERYCYIFFIFGVGWGKGVKGGPLGGTKKTKNDENRRKTKKIEGQKNWQKSSCSVIV